MIEKGINMVRREFLSKSFVFPFFPFIKNCKVSINRTEYINKESKLAKVKKVLLTMQRASWEHGIAAQAFYEAGDMEIAYLMAVEAVHRQSDEGQLCVMYYENGVTDPASAGEVVFRMWERTGDEYFKKGYERMLDYLKNKAPRTDGILHHVKNAPELWIDSLYMAPPFLAVVGEYKDAIHQIRGYRKYLWDSDKKMFRHIFNIKEKKFRRVDFWGGGNGWAAAGMARVIDTLPENYSEEKREIIQYVTELLSGCIECMRDDGLFYDVIDNKDSFIEANLSQMLAYSIFKGINSGWLDKRWLKYGIKVREGVNKCVDEHGFVRSVCGVPFFDRPGTSAEAQAFLY